MARVTQRLAERLESLESDGDYVDAVKARLNPRVAGLVGIQQELVREAAASLGRQGARLERALRNMQDIELAFLRTPTEALAAAHQAEHKEAERLLCNLKIQREAWGLCDHRELDRRYPLPRRLK
jgi:hypothetical protein